MQFKQDARGVPDDHGLAGRRYGRAHARYDDRRRSVHAAVPSRGRCGLHAHDADLGPVQPGMRVSVRLNPFGRLAVG
jgi:hypothetical protein